MGETRAPPPSSTNLPRTWNHRERRDVLIEKRNFGGKGSGIARQTGSYRVVARNRNSEKPNKND
jgi:hypothetical protein